MCCVCEHVAYVRVCVRENVCMIFTKSNVCVRTCKERGCRHDQTIHHLPAEDLDGRVEAANPLCFEPYSAVLTFWVHAGASYSNSNILHLTQVCVSDSKVVLSM